MLFTKVMVDLDPIRQTESAPDALPQVVLADLDGARTRPHTA